MILVFMHGLGKALPRGEAVLAPFFCDIFGGEPMNWTGDRAGLMEQLDVATDGLASEGHFAPWD